MRHDVRQTRRGNGSRFRSAIGGERVSRRSGIAHWGLVCVFVGTVVGMVSGGAAMARAQEIAPARKLPVQGPAPVAPDGKRAPNAEGANLRIAEERIVLQTAAGDIVLVLYPDVAPAHVAQMLQLVRLGVYDGMRFHRHDPGFVLQVSTHQDRLTPLSPEQQGAVHPLRAEFSGHPHLRGTVSMAHQDNLPDSGETSFSILLGPAPHLDGNYTIFGEVERGWEVIDELLKVPCVKSEPIVRMSIQRAEVLTPQQLAARPRTAARPVEIPPQQLAKYEQYRQAEENMRSGAYVQLQIFTMVSVIVIMVLVGLAQFFLGGWISPRRLLSLGMLNVLIGGFLLFALLAAEANNYVVQDPRGSLLGIVLFVAVLGIIKLMNRFESSE